jgi:uridylate kinase
MVEQEERFYPLEVAREYGPNRYKTWVVKDRLKHGSIAVFGGVVVPGGLTEAEAIKYAKRLNGMIS